LGALAAADRPIKMFPSLRQAHTWLGHHRRQCLLDSVACFRWLALSCR
jgi:hypothetical protein